MTPDTEPTTRILFVDDEPAILGALQNLLRRRRRVWDMRFASSGAEALEQLRAHPFDVVVSDLRMPGMDGASLLAEVRALQPWAIRMVLSGHAERAMLMRAVAVAHQFVSKPCEVDDLVRTIERASAIQRAIPSREMAALAGAVERLPTAPSVLRDLGRVLGAPAVSTRDIARVVARDPGLSAKVLQLANSDFFGRARVVHDVAQAVSLLGRDGLDALTQSAGSAEAGVEVEASLGTTIESMQRHALETALVARALAPPPRRDLAFTAGLLHDIGRVVLAARTPERLAVITQMTRLTGQPTHLVEREVLGTTHAEVGAHLLAIWGIPAVIVEAVACHHEPGPKGGEGGDIGAIVQAAEALIAEVTGQDEPTLDDALLGRAGVLGSRPDWVDLAKATLGLMQSVN